MQPVGRMAGSMPASVTDWVSMPAVLVAGPTATVMYCIITTEGAEK